MMFFSWGAEFLVKRGHLFYHKAAIHSNCIVVSAVDNAGTMIVTRVILRWEQWWFSFVLEDVSLEDVWRVLTLPASFVLTFHHLQISRHKPKKSRGALGIIQNLRNFSADLWKQKHPRDRKYSWEEVQLLPKLSPLEVLRWIAKKPLWNDSFQIWTWIWKPFFLAHDPFAANGKVGSPYSFLWTKKSESKEVRRQKGICDRSQEDI